MNYKIPNFKDVTTINEGYVSGEGLVDVLKQQGNNLVGVEIGVCRAETTCYLAEHCSNIKTIYGIDPWKEYNDGVGQGQWPQKECDEYYEISMQNIRTKYAHRITLLRETSLEANKRFEKESIDFIFIDGNHSYESVKEDLNMWYPIVKPGGIFAGHDTWVSWVVYALNEFRSKNNIKHPLVPLKNSAWYWKK